MPDKTKTPRRWFDRRFELGLNADAMTDLLDRLRQTPERLRNALRDLPPETLTRRLGDKWSIQDNVGHLLDLEPLWDRRLDDYEAGSEVLHPADLENRKTHEANHNARAIEELLAEFAAVRDRIVDRLSKMSAADVARTGLHPRLRQPMTVVDLCYFVAEHDEHHLRRIEELKSKRPEH